VAAISRSLGSRCLGCTTFAQPLSLQERLDRVNKSQAVEVERRIRRVHELAAMIRSLAPPGYFAQDFDELLYDENGLPVW
jgi:hypothetical protein